MRIKFTADRPPFKEGETIDVAPQTAQDYIEENVAVLTSEEDK